MVCCFCLKVKKEEGTKEGMKERRGKGSRVEKVIKEERREARMKEVKKGIEESFFKGYCVI